MDGEGLVPAHDVVAPSGAGLVCVVGMLVGEPVVVERCSTTAIPVDAIGTEAVLHLQGTAQSSGSRSDPVPWDVLVKIIRSPRHWPLLNQVPNSFRDAGIAGYPWRAELDMRDAGVAGLMPPGLRLPVLYRRDELGDDRVALWLEWIETAPGDWDRERYHRAAVALGRLTARCRGRAEVHRSGAGPGTPLRAVVDGPINGWLVPRLAEPGLAGHPMFAGTALDELLHDLRTLAGRLPALLDHFDTLPRSLGHGDACPQNLLTPVDEPQTLVAIDLTWPYPEAIGFDLGQLLIGHAHTGDLSVGALPAIHDVIVDGFMHGLALESCEVPMAEVVFAFEATLVVRNAFQSLPLDRLPEPVTPDLVALAARRVELTRYLVDVGLAMSAGPARRTNNNCSIT
ncbi:aminoglycoside phosphotransferase [Nakamurella sp.]|uniref:aminoglycoside phosphotransferase n=1 Tax=Nakamurella sp. TaxID=1869182 RepID=UPI00378528A4